MTYVFFFFALLAGIALSVQAGLNSQFRTALGSPIMAGLIACVMSVIALAVYALIFQRQDFYSLANLKGIPWKKMGG